MNRFLYTWGFLTAWAILPALAGATAQEPQGKPTAALQAQAPLKAPVVDSGVRYESGDRRDPFLNPLLGKKKEPDIDEEIGPLGQPPPGIAGMYINKVKLLGIVQGGESPTAIFQGSDQRTYFVKESDRLFDGFVRKIENDAVILVRETRLRSGKISTKEEKKWLRKP